MTTIDTHAPAAPLAAESVDGTTVGSAVSGVAAWVTTTDHKRIGRLFVGVSMLGLLGVSALGVLLGVERAGANNDLFGNSLTQVFAAYRVGLTFIVVLPLLLGIAIAVVPLQIGARSLAFPRLAAGGFWAWLLGSGLVIGSIAANGGPGGGTPRFVALYMGAHLLLIVGLVAAAVCVATTVLTGRAPGMNLRRVPPFTWSALVGSVGLILSLPVLGGTMVATYVDYRVGRAGFGGNKQIDSWLGFASTQPQTFLYVVFAFGLLLEGVAIASRRRLALRGVAFAGIGLVGLGLFGGVTQVPADIRRDIVHSSFGTFLSDALPFAIVNVLPLLGGLVVLGVAAFALASGRPRINAAMVFGLLGCLMIFMGMLGNALQHIGDARLGGTVFEEGAWIYVCYGGVLAALGAVTHWGPKFWGRVLPAAKVLPLAGLGFIATVLASLPYYIAGFAKQGATDPNPVYGGPHALWNVLVTAGHGLMLLTVLAFIGLALRTFTRGDHAGDDPYDGQTLEWATTSPAPEANFPEIFTVTSPEPLLDLKPARSVV